MHAELRVVLPILPDVTDKANLESFQSSFIRNCLCYDVHYLIWWKWCLDLKILELIEEFDFFHHITEFVNLILTEDAWSDLLYIVNFLTFLEGESFGIDAQLRKFPNESQFA